MNWFEVDKKGLANLLGRRGKAFLVHELVQNAWDTNATRVDVNLVSLPGRKLARLTVEDDDPEGFKDISHAFTLFAESAKKGDAEKRGRFNLGEKLVLALCKEAKITTTTGGVKFSDKGRQVIGATTMSGSIFEALIPLTDAELGEMTKSVACLIPPAGIATFYNGDALLERMPLHEFEITLPTEIANAEGQLRRTERKTKVQVFDPQDGEQASIYEMGIPIVETEDKWHYNVLQKVPLNMDRDNVTPHYLKTVRAAVLNAMHEKLTPEDASTPWVREGAADENATKEATEKVMDLRFGKKRVIFDPSDLEGNKLAVSEGYTVIPPRSLNKDEWDNVRKHDLAKPAGQVTPSPKPYSPEGDPLKILPELEWTDPMKRVAEYARWLAQELLGNNRLHVIIAREATWPYGATYGMDQLTLNLGRLGHDWFKSVGQHTDRLLIHEFGHHYAADHLSKEYYDALCKLGAKMTALALQYPEVFKGFRI